MVQHVGVFGIRPAVFTRTRGGRVEDPRTLEAASCYHSAHRGLTSAARSLGGGHSTFYPRSSNTVPRARARSRARVRPEHHVARIWRFSQIRGLCRCALAARATPVCPAPATDLLALAISSHTGRSVLRPYETPMLFRLPRIIGWVHVADGERSHAVYLEGRGSLRHHVVPHLTR
jgi:hypothetical protein